MSRTLQVLSSTRFTAPTLALLLIAVLASHLLEDVSRWWGLAPTSALMVNLTAALMYHRAFRTQPGLLVFHIALLLVLLLLALAQLVAFSARIELSQGQAFDVDDLEIRDSGPWHRLEWLEQVRFQQRRLDVSYSPGMVRGHTRVHVAVRGTAANTLVEFGDTQALELASYRFYTTSNKGFAAHVRFIPEAGPAQEGSINFPSYPLNDWRQTNRWVTPNGERLELELLFHTVAWRSGHWRLNETALSQVRGLVVRSSRGDVALKPGESLAVQGGRVEFSGTGLWMGYRIVHEPLLPLTLATALVGIAGLAWHVSLGVRGFARPAELTRRGALGV